MSIADLPPALRSLAAAFAALSALLAALLPVLWLERKLAARLQGRIGPFEVGRPHGWAQPIADVVKLMRKGDAIPAAADKVLFLAAPVWTATCAIAPVVLLPVAPGVVVVGGDFGLLLFLAVASLPGLGLLAAGWASANKYAWISALRYVAQLAAFEIPLFAAALVPALLAGTLNLDRLVAVQPAAGPALGHPLGALSFLLFFTAMLAEGNRAPFDLAEAESELIAGVTIEYSGMRFALFYLAEYASVFLFGTLACVLWFGGYRGPIAAGPHWLIGKAFVMFSLVTLLRWAFVRLRVDQFLRLSWLALVPAAFALVLATMVVAP
jgi:NADH-quinone oxidoreductase subunit H